MTNKRHKAFIGAIIGTAANVIGGAIKNKKQRKAAEKQRALEQAQQVRTETYQQANALQQMLDSSAIEQEFANRMTLKAGGKTKYDRIKYNKKYACGGRSKKNFGTSEETTKEITEDSKESVNSPIPIKTKVSNFLNSNGGSSAIQGIGNLASAIIEKPIVQKPIEKSIGFDFGGPKTTITANSYDANIVNPNIGNTSNNLVPNNMFQDRVKMQKFGGKTKRKC